MLVILKNSNSNEHRWRFSDLNKNNSKVGKSRLIRDLPPFVVVWSNFRVTRVLMFKYIKFLISQFNAKNWAIFPKHAPLELFDLTQATTN
jgi:hypothetical protein